MLTAAPKTLCREIFLSAPYSTIVPKKPALWGQNTAAGMYPSCPLAYTWGRMKTESFPTPRHPREQAARCS